MICSFEQYASYWTFLFEFAFIANHFLFIFLSFWCSELIALFLKTCYLWLHFECVFLFSRREDYNAIMKMFPLATIEYISGAGHWLHSEKPAEFQELVFKYIVGHSHWNMFFKLYFTDLWICCVVDRCIDTCQQFSNLD